MFRSQRRGLVGTIQFRTLGAILVSLAVIITATAGISAAADWNGRLVLDTGHVDAVHVTLEDDQLSMHLREDVTGSHVVHDADDVVLQVTDSAQFAIPDIDGFEFLGDAGDSTWLIPEVQEPDVVWAGWDTEEIETGQLQGDVITLALTEVEGPGTVHIFNNGPVGEAVMIFDPQSGQRTHTVPVNAHVHANWAFSAAGTYHLTFTASATTTDGTAVQASATYLFVVGALPDTDPDPTATTDPTATDPDPTATDPDPTATDPTATTDPTPTSSSTDPSATSPCPTGSGTVDPTGTADPTDSTEPPTGSSTATQDIQATIGADEGSLVLSVDPDDHTVTLPDATLAPAATSWSTTGELRPVTVTDTRTGAPGWNVVGQVGTFTSTTGQFDGKYLGWTPKILEQTTDNAVQPGDTVTPALTTGTGLAASSTLATAAAGTGSGVAILGADLDLTVPATTETGTYTATLTLTAI